MTIKYCQVAESLLFHVLAIEYFIDSKGERQNIKLLSTQNNYSPSFGLKKLVIFFISSDKTDKKLCRSWKYKTRCRTKRRGGQGMAFDQGASRPQGTIKYRRKRTCFKSFFILIIFLFSTKSEGGGGGGGRRKKVVGPRPYQPLPLRGPWVVGKSARDNPKRHCGWVYVFTFLQRNLKEWHLRPWTYVCEC